MKDFIIKKYTLLKYLLLALLVCFFLLVFRIKTTQNYFGLFLVWNLFLAFVPLGIVWFIQDHKSVSENPIKRYATLSLWLLFLPNAPYVITDLIHLSYSPAQWIVYDAFTILAFAGISLYFGFLSILELRALFKNQLSKMVLNTVTFSVLALCGFGIYLGRVVRFNSWDLITNPFALVERIATFLFNPVLHRSVWLFTLACGLLLNIGYYIFHCCYKTTSTDDSTN